MKRNKRSEEEEQLIQESLNQQLEFDKAIIAQNMIEAAKETEKQRTAASITQDVAENQDKAAEVIRTDESLPSDVKDNMMIATTNPIEVQEAAKRGLATQDAKESDGTIKSQFLDALTFFGPQIIGGLFGASEGDAGMLAGAEMGGKLRDSYIDYNFKKQDREISRQRQLAGRGMQQSKEFMTKDGKPLMFDPQFGFLDMQGKPVSQDDVVSGISARQDRSLAERQETRKLAERKFGFSKQQAAQLSDKQQDQLREILNVEKNIARIEELRQQFNDTGPLAGRVNSLMQFADLAPEEFTRLKTTTASALSNYVKSISGAQVTEQEAIRLMAVVPNVNDAPNVFKSKLDEFREIVRMNKSSFAESIRTGQPLKAGSLKGLDAAYAKFAPKSAKDTRAREQKILDRIQAVKAGRKR